MRPGKTVFEWMQDHDVRSLGIDIRRFASFGVIKVRIFLPPPKTFFQKNALIITPAV
jgi:hypothetical protein